MDLALLRDLPLRLEGERSSPPRAGEKLEQEAAPGDAHQSEYPAPKAPGVSVDADQRQAFVQLILRLMDNRVRGLDACNFFLRHESQQHFVGVPFDTEVAQGARSERPLRAAFRVPQKHCDFVRRRRRELPRAIAAILRQKCTGKIASQSGGHYRILLGIFPPASAVGCAGGSTDEIASRASLEQERQTAARLFCRRRPRFSVHGQQRRAGGAERHRYLVHWTCIASRDRGHWRRLLAGAGLRTLVRRRGSRGTNLGGAGLRWPSLCASIPGDVDGI